jgi:cell cycle checkpoint protein
MTYKHPAIAFIPTNLFQTFTYHPPSPSQGPACFELSLDALLQVLNIFGNANTGSTSTANSFQNKRRWAGEGDGDDDALGGAAGGGGKIGKGGRTGMRMSWRGPGWPLSVLLCVSFTNTVMQELTSRGHRRDDAKGPTTDCELKVLEPEELMNQTFNSDDWWALHFYPEHD